MSGRVARALAVLVVMLGLGVGAGFAIGALTQDRPTTMTAADPVPAVSPSMPVQTVAPYKKDVDYPTLGTDLAYAPQVVGAEPFVWGYQAPRGWKPQPIGPNEIVWTPPDPVEGGYGMRVKVVSERKTPLQMVAEKIDDLGEAVEDIDVLGRTSDSLAITYRTDGDRLRYNTFRWFTRTGEPAAQFEVSVFGRRQDLEGLGDLLDQISASVRFDPPDAPAASDAASDAASASPSGS